MSELTPKQQQFCVEYLSDLNATKAAERAGYSPKTAAEQASRLLTKVKVQSEIAALRDSRAAASTVTVQRVLREFGRIGFADPRRLLDEHGNPKPLHELDDDIAAAIASVELETVTKPGPRGKQVITTRLAKVRLVPKNPALESIAKHLGMFNPELAPGIPAGVGPAVPRLGDIMAVWQQFYVIRREGEEGV